jgi:hypothetical protein
VPRSHGLPGESEKTRVETVLNFRGRDVLRTFRYMHVHYSTIQYRSPRSDDHFLLRLSRRRLPRFSALVIQLEAWALAGREQPAPKVREHPIPLYKS